MRIKMKALLPFDFGQTVYVISQTDKDLMICQKCNGQGVYSWEDDYGGYRSSQCTCKAGMVKKTGKEDLEWVIIGTMVVMTYRVTENALMINYRDSFDSGVDWTDCFSSKGQAEKECQRRDKPALRKQKTKTHLELN